MNNFKLVEADRIPSAVKFIQFTVNWTLKTF